MNERIKQLAEQASLELFNDTAQHRLLKGFAEKFAELIIRECVNKIVMEQDNADQNWSCKNGVHISWEMLDHFGVDK